MPILKTINLTPETHKIWEDNFAGTEEFSGFVQQCLLDLKAKKNSKGYLLEQIAEEEARKAESDKKIVCYKNKLKDISCAEEAVNQIKPVKLDRAALEREMEKQIKKMLIWCPNLNGEVLTTLAKEYLEIAENLRPTAKDFLTKKGIYQQPLPSQLKSPGMEASEYD